MSERMWDDEGYDPDDEGDLEEYGEAGESGLREDSEARDERGRWVKGQSGNPKGRPPKGLAITEALREIGNLKVEFVDDSEGNTETDTDGEGERIVTYREALAEMLWDAAQDGVIQFGDGREVKLNAREWFEIVKWIKEQVEPQRRRVQEVRYLGVGNDPEKQKRQNTPIKIVWGDD